MGRVCDVTMPLSATICRP